MPAFSQSSTSYPEVKSYRLSKVQAIETQYKGDSAIQIRMSPKDYQDQKKEALSDRDFMAWIPITFGNGTIDVDVASELASDAPDYARGFVGIAFRIDGKNRFESIYLRPTNSVVEEQIRRNHSVQYAAYPDFRFSQLRKDFPEKYETYADIALERWVHLRIEVSGEKALLFLDHRASPAFVVTDLKLGPEQSGGVGVWIESGTVAYFKNLRITTTP